MYHRTDTYLFYVRTFRKKIFYYFISELCICLQKFVSLIRNTFICTSYPGHFLAISRHKICIMMSEITFIYRAICSRPFIIPGLFFPDLPMPVFSSRPSACRVTRPLEAGRFEGVFSGNCTLMSIIPLNLLQIQIRNTALQYSFTNQDDKNSHRLGRTAPMHAYCSMGRAATVHA